MNRQKEIVSPTIDLPGTPRATAFRSLRTPCHLNTFPIDERIGNLSSGFVEIAPCSLAGYTEFFCCLFLLKSFEIDKTDQLDLIRIQRDTRSAIFRATAGFVAPRLGCCSDDTPEPGSSSPGTFFFPVGLVRSHYCSLAYRTYPG